MQTLSITNETPSRGTIIAFETIVDKQWQFSLAEVKSVRDTKVELVLWKEEKWSAESTKDLEDELHRVDALLKDAQDALHESKEKEATLGRRYSAGRSGDSSKVLARISAYRERSRCLSDDAKHSKTGSFHRVKAALFKPSSEVVTVCLSTVLSTFSSDNKQLAIVDEKQQACLLKNAAFNRVNCLVKYDATTVQCSKLASELRILECYTNELEERVKEEFNFLSDHLRDRSNFKDTKSDPPSGELELAKKRVKELETFDSRWNWDVDAALVTTPHSITFQWPGGAGVVHHHPEEAIQVMTSEVAYCCHVPIQCVSEVTISCEGDHLHSAFKVTHPTTSTSTEIDRRVRQHPFHSLYLLHKEDDATKRGLDRAVAEVTRALGIPQGKYDGVRFDDFVGQIPALSSTSDRDSYESEIGDLLMILDRLHNENRSLQYALDKSGAELKKQAAAALKEKEALENDAARLQDIVAKLKDLADKQEQELEYHRLQREKANEARVDRNLSNFHNPDELVDAPIYSVTMDEYNECKARAAEALEALEREQCQNEELFEKLKGSDEVSAKQADEVRSLNTLLGEQQAENEELKKENEQLADEVGAFRAKRNEALDGREKDGDLPVDTRAVPADEAVSTAVTPEQIAAEPLYCATLDELNAARAANDELQKALEEQQAENDELVKDAEAKEEQSGALARDLDQQKDELQKNLEEQQAENEELKKENEQLADEVGAFRAKRNEALDAREKDGDLPVDTRAVPADEAVSTAVTPEQIAADPLYCATLDELNAARAANEELQGKNDELQKNLEEQQAENEELKKENEQLADEVGAFRAKRNEALDAREKDGDLPVDTRAVPADEAVSTAVTPEQIAAEPLYCATLDELNAARAANDELQKALEEQQAENEELKKDAEAKEEQSGALARDLDQQKDELQKNLEEQQAENEELKKENEQLADEVGAFRAKRNEALDAREKDGDLPVDTRAVPADEAVSTAVTPEQIAAEPLYCATLDELNAARAANEELQGKNDELQKNLEEQQAENEELQKSLDEQTGDNEKLADLAAERERVLEEDKQAMEGELADLVAQLKALEGENAALSALCDEREKEAELLKEQAANPGYNSDKSKPQATTSHVRVFDGDEWDVVVDRHPEQLKEAFVTDACSACGVTRDDLANVAFTVGSLHAAVDVTHNSDISSDAVDEMLGAYSFPNVMDLYARRHGPKRGLDALYEQMSELQGEKDELQKNLEEQQAENEELKKENEQLADEVGAFRAKRNEALDAREKDGDLPVDTRAVPADEAVSTAMTPEQIAADPLYCATLDELNAARAANDELQKALEEQQAQLEEQQAQIDELVKDAEAKEEQSGALARDLDQQKDELQKNLEEQQAENEELKKENEQLADEVGAFRAKRNEALDAREKDGDLPVDTRAVPADEAVSTAVTPEQIAAEPLYCATLDELNAARAANEELQGKNDELQKNLEEQQAENEELKKENEQLADEVGAFRAKRNEALDAREKDGDLPVDTRAVPADEAVSTAMTPEQIAAEPLYCATLDELNAARAANDELQKALEEQQAENEELKKDAETKEEQSGALARDLDQQKDELQKNLEEQQAENEELKKENEQLADEVGAFRAKRNEALDAREKDGDLPVDTRAVPADEAVSTAVTPEQIAAEPLYCATLDELNAARAANDELQKALEEQQAENEELKKDAETKEEQSGALARDLDQQKDELQKNLEEQQAENEELKKENEQLADEVGAFRAKRNEALDAREKDGDLPVDTRAVPADEAVSTAVTPEQIAAEPLYCATLDELNAARAANEELQGKNDELQKNLEEQQAENEELKKSLDEQTGDNEKLADLAAERERVLEEDKQAMEGELADLVAQLKALEGENAALSALCDEREKEAELLKEQAANPGYNSDKSKPQATTSHVRVFDGDEWDVVVDRHPEQLKEAFVTDACSACGVTRDDLANVAFTVGSLHAAVDVTHNSDISSDAVDEMLGAYSFPNVMDLYARRHGPKRGLDALYEQMSELQGEKDELQKNLEEQQAENEELKKENEQLADEVGAFRAKRNEALDAREKDGDLPVDTRAVPADEAVSTAVTPEQIAADPLYCATLDELNAARAANDELQKALEEQQAENEELKKDAEAKEEQSGALARDLDQQKDELQKNLEEQQAENEELKKENEQLADEVGAFRAKRNEALDAREKDGDLPVDTRAVPADEAVSTAVTPEQIAADPLYCATLDELNAARAANDELQKALEEQQAQLEEQQAQIDELVKDAEAKEEQSGALARDLDQQKDELQKNLEEQQAENEELKKENEQLADEVGAFRAKRNEALDAREKDGDLPVDTRAVPADEAVSTAVTPEQIAADPLYCATLDELNAARAANDELQKALEEQQAENEELKKDAEAKEEQSGALARDLDQQKDELQKNLEEQQAENEELKKENEQLADEVGAFRAKRNEALDAREKDGDLPVDTRAVPADEAVSTAVTPEQIAAEPLYCATLDELNAARAANEELQGKNDELQKNLEEQQAENEELKKENEQLADEVGAFRAKRNEALDAREKDGDLPVDTRAVPADEAVSTAVTPEQIAAEPLYCATLDELNAARAANDELQKALEEQQAENEELKKDAEAKEEQSGALARDLDQQKDELQKNLEEQQAENEELKKENEQLADEVGAFRAKRNEALDAREKDGDLPVDTRAVPADEAVSTAVTPEQIAAEPLYCATLDELNAARAANEELQGKNDELQKNLEEQQAENEELQKSLDEQTGDNEKLADLAAERERVLEEDKQAMEGELADLVAQLKALEGENAALSALCDEREKEAELLKEQAANPGYNSDKSKPQATTSHVRVFDGDEWDVVVDRHPEQLKEAFVTDACSACGVTRDDLANVAFTVGSLHAAVDVTHNSDISSDAVDEMLGAYSFPNVMDLYARRHGPKRGLDALYEQMSELQGEKDELQKNLEEQQAENEELKKENEQLADEVGAFRAKRNEALDAREKDGDLPVDTRAVPADEAVSTAVTPEQIAADPLYCATLDELNAARAANDELQKALEEQQAQLEEQQAQIDELVKDAEAKEEQSGALARDLDQQKDELQKNLEEQQAENEELKKENEQLADEVGAFRAKRNEALDAREKDGDLPVDTRAVPADEAVSTAVTPEQIAAEPLYCATLDELNAARAANEELQGKNDELQKNLEEQQAENEELKKENEQLADEVGAFRAKRNEALDAREKDGDLPVDTRAVPADEAVSTAVTPEQIAADPLYCATLDELNAARAANDELQKALEEQQAENEELKKDAEAKEEQSGALARDLDQQKDELQKNLEEQQAENEELKKENEQLADEVGAFRAKRNEALDAREKDGDLPVDTRAVPADEAVSTAVTPEQIAAEPLYCATLDELNAARAANEELQGKNDELQKNLEEQQAENEELQKSLDEQTGDNEKLADLAAERERVLEEDKQAMEGELADLVAQLKALEGENAALSALCDEREKEAELLKEQAANPGYNSDKSKPQATTSHVRVFDGDEWDVVVDRHPEQLKEAFVTDACSACGVTRDDLANVAFTVGSLHAAVDVTHNSDISSDAVDEMLGAYSFPNVMDLYARRHGPKRGLDALYEQMSELQGEKDELQKNLEEQQAENEELKKENEQLADEVGAFRAKRNEALDAREKDGDLPVDTRAVPADEAVSTAVTPEQIAADPLYCATLDELNAARAANDELQKALEEQQAQLEEQQAQIDELVKDAEAKEEQSGALARDLDQQKDELQKNLEEQQAENEELKKENEQLADEVGAFRAKRNEALDAREKDGDLPVDTRAVPADEAVSTAVTPEQIAADPLYCATLDELNAARVANDELQKALEEQQAENEELKKDAEAKEEQSGALARDLDQQKDELQKNLEEQQAENEELKKENEQLADEVGAFRAKRNEALDAREKDGDLPVDTRAVPADEAVSTAMTPEQIAADPLYCATLDELNAARAANEELQGKNDELQKNLEEQQAENEELQKSLDEQTGDNEKLADLAAERERVLEEDKQAMEGELADLVAQLKALEGENAALSALCDEREKEAELLKEQAANPGYNSDKSKPQATTSHVRVFDGDEWDVVVDRHPEQLKEAFVTDACSACGVTRDDLANVAFTVGSLHAAVDVTHNSDISSDAVDEMLGAYSFPNVMDLYARRHGPKRGLDALYEQMSELQGEKDELQKNLEEQQAENEELKKENEQLADEVGAFRAKRNEALDAREKDGDLPVDTRAVPADEAVSTAVTPEQIAADPLYCATLDELNAARAANDELQKALEEQQAQIDELVKDAEAKEEQSGALARDLDQQKDELQKNLEEQQAENEELKKENEQLADEVGAFRAKRNEALDAREKDGDLPVDTRAVPADEAVSTAVTPEQIAADPLYCATLDELNAARAANDELQKALEEQQAQLEEQQAQIDELVKDAEAKEEQSGALARDLDQQKDELQKNLEEQQAENEELKKENEQLADEVGAFRAKRNEALDAREKDGDLPVDTRAVPADEAVSTAVTPEQIAAEPLYCATLDELNAARAANEELQGKNDELQKNLDEQTGDNEKLADLAAERERVLEEDKQAMEGELADLVAQLKALEGENAALSALCDEREKEAELLKEQAANPGYNSDKSKPQATTSHVRVFDGDEWDVVVDRHPEQLKEAFVTDACSACGVTRDDLANVAFTVGSLHAAVDVTHNSDISSDAVDEMLGAYSFPNVMDLYARRHGPKRGLDALNEQMSELQGEKDELQKNLEEQQAENEELKKENEQLADEVGAFRAKRNEGS
ncbi:hypothetical protein, conserved [Angomonas deanei]|uniref:Flagellar attachment zone protein 1 conserved domain-containing protein n=1 Tax=Angomonas deanei TaxID=59799 RepID=A0A7G2C5D0_9TRYP|nr:hypothetical protein, conserved [Angomonas deanei]